MMTLPQLDQNTAKAQISHSYKREKEFSSELQSKSKNSQPTESVQQSKDLVSLTQTREAAPAINTTDTVTLRTSKPAPETALYTASASKKSSLDFQNPDETATTGASTETETRTQSTVQTDSAGAERKLTTDTAAQERLQVAQQTVLQNPATALATQANVSSQAVCSLLC